MDSKVDSFAFTHLFHGLIQAAIIGVGLGLIALLANFIISQSFAEVLAFIAFVPSFLSPGSMSLPSSTAWW